MVRHDVGLRIVGIRYIYCHRLAFPIKANIDTHKRNFESMRTKLPDLDRGLSALLEDLAARGDAAGIVASAPAASAAKDSPLIAAAKKAATKASH